MAKIDELDLKVIDGLRVDARKSFRELAEELDVAEGTIYNRVNKLKKAGVLRGFIADIDYAMLGYDLTAVIGVIVKGGHLPQIEERIAAQSMVTAVYDVTGQYDAVVVGKFRDRSDLNALVKKLTSMEHVDRTYTMIVLNVVKESHGLDFSKE